MIDTMPVEHPQPTESAKRQVLAACGNQCAFPGCNEIIVDREHGVLVGEIAHIKARKEGGPRFDPAQTEEENRSASNLIALCRRHHKVVDERLDIYTTENLIEMKKGHEEKVENTADRSWIRPPNTLTRIIPEIGTIPIHFWIDRTRRPRVYSDRQLAIVRSLMDLYLDIRRLCDLYEIVESNPAAPGSSIMQGHVKLDKSKADLDDGTPWSPITHLLRQMAAIPEVTLGELITFVVDGGDATSVFQAGARALEKKIRAIRELNPE